MNADLHDRLLSAVADRYHLERELGRGGMAVVYLAEDRKHGRRAALKVLRPELTPALGAERFQREIEIAARLQHPHILSLHDSGTAAGLLYYAMPYVEGETLRTRLAREVQLDAAEAIRIGGEVADALAYAHAAGVLHRDIKPENILLTAGHAMVADFGIARALDAASEERLTETGLALGTPHYMSPEQASGARTVDARSDIYALGCVVYEMLAGEPPFTGPTAQMVLARHAVDPVPCLRTVRPTITPALEAAVGKALAKVPSDRFAGALEFKRALTEASQAPPTIVRSPSRRPWMIGGLAVLGVAAAIAVLRAGLPSDSTTAPGAPIQSLAVAPFQNLTGDSAQVYLAEGITDQLVTTLAQIGRLRVVPLKGSPAGISGEQLARAYRIEAILSGSLQRAGERVRIRLQLSTAATGQAIWARSYDGDMAGILGLQDQVARSVAERLEVAPSSEKKSSSLVQPREVSPEAFEAYVRGTYFLGKVTEADFRKGIGYFQRAIDLEPTYAAAYNGLAQCYGELGYYALEAPNDVFPKARAAALRALELDSTLGDAHATLGQVEFQYSWDLGAADREFRRAIELRPNTARTRIFYHTYLAAMGRQEESIAQAKASVQLDPLTLLIQAAAARPYYNARKYEEALAQARKALEIDSTFSRAHFWAGLAQEQMNRPEEGIRALEETVVRAGRIPVYIAALGHAYAVAGRRERALALLHELQDRARTAYVSPYDLATVYVGLNMRDAAFRHLDEAYAARAYGLVFINVDPRFDPVRSDPRFADLIRRIGLPPVPPAS